MDPWLEQFNARRADRADRTKDDRTITLLGETLTVKPVIAPEVALRLDDFQSRIAEYLTVAEAAREAGAELPEAGIDDGDLLDVSEFAIRSALDPGSLDAWERLRSPEAAEPLGLMEIYGLARFLVSKVTLLPTDAPSGSSDGPTSNGASSKAGSSSTAAGRKR